MFSGTGVRWLVTFCEYLLCVVSYIVVFPFKLILIVVNILHLVRWSGVTCWGWVGLSKPKQVEHSTLRPLQVGIARWFDVVGHWGEVATPFLQICCIGCCILWFPPSN